MHPAYQLRRSPRKAGGVYYTPTFIVDTIVRETLGRLLAGLSMRR